MANAPSGTSAICILADEAINKLLDLVLRAVAVAPLTQRDIVACSEPPTLPSFRACSIADVTDERTFELLTIYLPTLIDPIIFKSAICIKVN